MSSSGRTREIRLAILLAVSAFLFWLAFLMPFRRPVSSDYANNPNTRVRQDFSTIQSALNLFRMNAGRYPTNDEGLAALVERPTDLDLERWEMTLRKVPLDLWLNPYSYEFPSKQGTDRPDLSSAGPDMIFGTVDDIGNWEGE